MTRDYRGPDINARRLGLYLQRTREIVGLSYDEAAARLGCDSDWLVRVETGFETPPPDRVERMLERYKVRSAKAADIMIDLASRPHGPGWLASHEMKAATRDALISESEASVVRTYAVQRVPDLAQAEPYGRLLAAQSLMEKDEETEWTLLSHRQRYRPGGRRRFLDVIIDEMALTIPFPDPRVMVAQLRHLLELDDGPDATVRVVPTGAKFYEARAHPFDVLEFPAISDRISLVHTILGIDFAFQDLTDIWERIEQDTAPAAESRKIISTHLTHLTTDTTAEAEETGEV